MSLIMKQAGGARSSPGGRYGGQGNRPMSSQMMREYAVGSQFHAGGAAGDPFIHGWVIKGIVKVGGKLLRKIKGPAAQVGGGVLVGEQLGGQTYDPTTEPGLDPGLQHPYQENGRRDIPGQRLERILPFGKTGEYSYEQIAGWKDRAGRASGYRKHWNKSGYYRQGQDGPVYIFPGMIQVTNRHRNPQNWRATGHALTRTRAARGRAERIMAETKSTKQVHAAKHKLKQR